ncbi:thiopeptide-type bacteriocin biosynthesis protein [Chryseobacterium sp. PMSZPI]|uniref:thiopeptide-type bacteriocin biosynthesis protein n=1 Tax=Chryseobacterium sp. PMSZPI TaxID=1033900 RepID=UPI000C34FBDB|nr:thiopeptide-type bacteriocin biosynthesis protein [Chryseobacterium sp. PMSZPI]PKF75847.1 hypothetical protein CW752_02035 [Chryseobacterium sp. PMSZPI]
MKTRKYAPGSEWLYFKIYTGYKTADTLLLNSIYPLITSLKRKKYIQQFFFIRYSDPHHHIRVRLHITEPEYLGEIMILFNHIFSKLLNNNTVWKIQMDTYNREVERYNIHLMEQSEHFFHIDSDAVITILKTINAQYSNREDIKWIIGLKLIDDTLNLFYDKEEDKMDIISKMSESFKIEFGFDQFNSKQFNEKYRENKIKIENVLSGAEIIEDQNYIPLYALCGKRYKDLLPIVAAMKQIQIEKKISNTIAFDLIHMLLNRLIPAQNRLHELLLYDFVKRYYASTMARKNNTKNIKYKQKVLV